MGDNSCKGDHRSHLCSLAGNKRIREIRHLVTDPKYICSKCGRVADEEVRVCKPESLDA